MVIPNPNYTTLKTKQDREKEKMCAYNLVTCRGSGNIWFFPRFLCGIQIWHTCSGDVLHFVVFVPSLSAGIGFGLSEMKMKWIVSILLAVNIVCIGVVKVNLIHLITSDDQQFILHLFPIIAHRLLIFSPTIVKRNSLCMYIHTVRTSWNFVRTVLCHCVSYVGG